MEASPRLPGLLQKLENHPQADDTRKRGRMDECIPPDVLKEVMGYLDHESLCTARLVSKTFCAAASAHICSLTLASTTRGVSFHRYTHVEHVTVTHVYASSLGGEESSDEEEGGSQEEEGSLSEKEEGLDEEEGSLAGLDPRLRDLATTLTIGDVHYSARIAQTRDYLSQAALMPKLRKLEVPGVMEQEAALLARCTNLEAISFGRCSRSVARAIVTMTRLTSLHIGSVSKVGSDAPCTDVSWLERATNLTSLQTLSICTLSGALPLIGNLTGLTGLTVSAWLGLDRVRYSFAPLSRLTRLRSLSILEGLTESNLAIACSLGSGSLVNLGLCVRDEASADCGRYLTRQTALRRLSLDGRQLCNLQHIRALRIELLQCLEIFRLDVLNAEGIYALCRATSLTKLAIGTGVTEPQMGMSQVLARLPQLRFLRLMMYGQGHDAVNILDLPLALSPLTALTELRIRAHVLDDRALGRCCVSQTCAGCSCITAPLHMTRRRSWEC